MSKIARRILKRKRRVALLVDGPNILRKEFNVKLEDIWDIAKEHGKVEVARVYLNQYAPTKLLEAISNSGFSPKIVTSDIHVNIAIEAMNLINENNHSLILIASRHARTAPILRYLREKGVDVIAIGFEPGFSIAVQKAATKVHTIVPEEPN